MKIVLQDSRGYMLRFDKDEEVMAGLMEFARAQNIGAAFFSAIGTCGQAEIGFFNPFLKEYRHKILLGEREIVSLTGNIAISGGNPAIHAHGIFANGDYETAGGHVFKITTLATCEVFLLKLEGGMKRENSPEFNLNLLV